MKGLFLPLFALVLVSCVSVPAIKHVPKEEAKIYTTYLVNESSHFAEYVIENLDAGVEMYSGILPPKWAIKNDMKSWEDYSKNFGNTPPWVLKVEIHEDLLGAYKIHLRFLYTREGAHTDGRWRSKATYLTKEDFQRTDNLFPYWEIHNDPVKRSHMMGQPAFSIQKISSDCNKSGCKERCEKHFQVPLDKAEDFMYCMSLKEMKIQSCDYEKYMDLVYFLLYNGYEDAGNLLRKHLRDVELI